MTREDAFDQGLPNGFSLSLPLAGCILTLMRKKWKKHQRNGFHHFCYSFFDFKRTSVYLFIGAYLHTWFHDFGYW